MDDQVCTKYVWYEQGDCMDGFYAYEVHDADGRRKIAHISHLTGNWRIAHNPDDYTLMELFVWLVDIGIGMPPANIIALMVGEDRYEPNTAI